MSVAVVTGICVVGVMERLAPPAVPAARARHWHADAGTKRDWQKAPAILELNTSEDIYAVGDVHGDYDRLVALLALGKVIAEPPKHPEQVRWSAGKSIFVCTGDLIDKGRHSLKVIALFRALAKDAAAAKGQVVVLMGNHEAQFLHDPDDDDKSELVRELDKHGINPRKVAAGEDEQDIGKFLNALPVAARVNDWFFAHAGDTQGLTLKKLQTAVEKEVSEKDYKTAVLLGKHGLLEARLHNQPWWEKEDDAPGKGEARLRAYVEALGARHLVIGHQPGKVVFKDGTIRAKGTMIQKFNGLIFLIDVGMSEAIDYSKGALLHIHGGQHPRAVAHYPDKDKETLWPNP
jgi:hypothetical protein